MIEIIDSDNPAMSVFTPGQLETLNDAIQTVESRLSVSKVDYQKGDISLGMIYNEGTKDEFFEPNFMVLSVACDSVAAAFYDVYTRAYQRCI